jgi:ATP-binding cassette subfamily B protein
MSSYIRFADTTVFQVIPLLSSLVFTLIILSTRAPLFVTILLLFSIFYIISAILISRAVRRLSAIQANAESTQTGYLADAIINVMAIKSFAGGLFEKKEFGKITSNTQRRTLDVMRGSRYQLIYLTSITNTISALALVMAVVGVMVFKSNLATVFLILTYTASIANQLFAFGTITEHLVTLTTWSRYYQLNQKLKIRSILKRTGLNKVIYNLLTLISPMMAQAEYYLKN